MGNPGLCDARRDFKAVERARGASLSCFDHTRIARKSVPCRVRQQLRPSRDLFLGESVALMLLLLLLLKNGKWEALRGFTAVRIGTNIGISTPAIATNSCNSLVAMCSVSLMRFQKEKYFRNPFPGCQRWIPIKSGTSLLTYFQLCERDRKILMRRMDVAVRHVFEILSLESE